MKETKKFRDGAGRWAVAPGWSRDQQDDSIVGVWLCAWRVPCVRLALVTVDWAGARPFAHVPTLTTPAADTRFLPR